MTDIDTAASALSWAAGRASGTVAAAQRSGVAGVHPPPGWRQVPTWPSEIPAWPDSGHPNPWVWLLGLHGGAGVTTLTSALPATTGDAHRRVPAGTATGQSPYVVAVARTHMEGLTRAQEFARQLACELVPETVRVLGLVLVADAERKPCVATRRFGRVVAAAYPHCWSIPWISEWRSHRPAPQDGALPEPVDRIGRDLIRMTGQSTQDTTSQRSVR